MRVSNNGTGPFHTEPFYTGPFYIELLPPPGHATLVDHICILKDDGRLTAPARHVFASPFRNIHFSCRMENVSDPTSWTYRDLPPAPERRSRIHAFSGWMLALRCSPAIEPTVDARALSMIRRALAHAVPRFSKEGRLDSVVAVLDDLAKSVVRGTAATGLLPALAARAPQSIWRYDVASLSVETRLSPRTLHRHFRTALAMTPKRWLALRRFGMAAQRIAGGTEALAQLAVDAGYADQSHLSTEFARFAGIPPARFRSAARQSMAGGPVRFFKDDAIGARVRLRICDAQKQFYEGPS